MNTQSFLGSKTGGAADQCQTDKLYNPDGDWLEMLPLDTEHVRVFPIGHK